MGLWASRLAMSWLFSSCFHAVAIVI